MLGHNYLLGPCERMNVAPGSCTLASQACRAPPPTHWRPAGATWLTGLRSRGQPGQLPQGIGVVAGPQHPRACCFTLLKALVRPRGPVLPRLPKHRRQAGPSSSPPLGQRHHDSVSPVGRVSYELLISSLVPLKERNARLG
jgi:hypothetical protein